MNNEYESPQLRTSLSAGLSERSLEMRGKSAANCHVGSFSDGVDENRYFIWYGGTAVLIEAIHTRSLIPIVLSFLALLESLNRPFSAGDLRRARFFA